MKRRIKSKQRILAAPLGFWDRPSSSLVLILIASALVFVSSANPAAFDDIRSSATNAVSPLISIVSYPVQEATTFVRNVSGLSEMQTKIAELEKENTRLREWYQTALVLEEQNNSLRDLLNVKIDPKREYMSGRIIADVGSAFVKSLLVKLGQEDGVEKGNAVVSGDGLIGRLINVSSQTSRVLLLTDMNSRVPVIVEGTKQHAILAGRNSSDPVLEHLPKEVDLQQGARIITSGHGGMFPAGIPIGVINADQNGALSVQLFSDMNALQYVRVIASEKQGLARAN